MSSTCCLDCSPRMPQKWVVAFMGFSAFFNAYALRSCLPMAMTQMAVPLNSTEEESIDQTCPNLIHLYDSTNLTISAIGPFEWSEYTQGIILSSFYWGYVLTQIPGGLMAEKYGAKYVLGMSILITSILTVLTPDLTEWGDATALIILQFLIGLCGGVVHPAMSNLLARWLAPDERSFIGSLVYYGCWCGLMVATSLSGYIMGNYNNSWPLIFHLFGTAGIVWFFIWVLVFSDDTINHRIAPSGWNKKHSFPWKPALTSKPFLALVMSNAASDYCIYTIIADFPKYLKNVLKLPVDLIGYASSIHLVSSRIFSIGVSWLSDKLIQNNCATITSVRKINTAIASVGPGVLLILAMYAGCNVIPVITLITVGMTLEGSQIPGMMVNVMDLSPNFAGTLMGLMNSVGGLCGILAPYTVGVLAPDQTLNEWRLVFWIIGIVFFVTTLNFALYGSGDVQPWDDPEFLKWENRKYEVLMENTRLLKLGGYNKSFG